MSRTVKKFACLGEILPHKERCLNDKARTMHHDEEQECFISRNIFKVVVYLQRFLNYFGALKSNQLLYAIAIVWYDYHNNYINH